MAAKVNTGDTWQQHQRQQSKISVCNNDLRQTRDKFRRQVKEFEAIQAKLVKLEADFEGAQVESDRVLTLHYEQVGQAKAGKARIATAAAAAAAADA